MGYEDELELFNLDNKGVDVASTIKRIDGSDTHLTIIEHIRRQGKELRRANLSGLSLRHVYLRDADLREANLTGANLEHAELEEVDLCQAIIQKANLQHADLKGAKLTRTNFTGSNLSGAILSSKETVLNKTIFCQVIAERIVFGESTSYYEVQGLIFTKKESNVHEPAELSQVDFAGANLQYANFKGVDLRTCRLNNGNISYANCEQADLRSMDLQSVKLVNVKFDGADVRGTKFPAGFIPPSSAKTHFWQ